MSEWKTGIHPKEDDKFVDPEAAQQARELYGPFFSKDALDQWSTGHGRDFLNRYKSQVDVKYFAQITSDRSPTAPRLPGSLIKNFNLDVELPDEVNLGVLADLVDSGELCKTELLKIMYLLFLYIQRQQSKNGGEPFIDSPDVLRVQRSIQAQRIAPINAAEQPETEAGPEVRRTFTPLPLRDENVSACAKPRPSEMPLLLPKLTDLPDFALSFRGETPVYPRAVVGVIDDAVNFSNDRFMADWGTRTEFAHIQDGKTYHARGEEESGCETSCKDRVFFGREFYRTEIQDRIDLYRNDPDELLKAFGLGPTDNRDRPVGYLHATHGTHVADLATGYSASEGDKHDIRLMSVQLPALAYFDNCGMAISFFMLEGVRFILWRSLFLQFMMNLEQVLRGEEPTKLPVVLNISYGLTGGPHSGGHYLEEGIDRLIQLFTTEAEDSLMQLGPIDVIVPAGNDFLTRRFATSRQGEDKLDVTMRVPARGRTSNFLEFWLPRRVKDTGEDVAPNISVNIAPPAGLVGGRFDLEPGVPKELYTEGDVIARLTLDKPVIREPLLWRVLLAIAPTDAVFTEADPCEEARQPAEPGRWKITVESDIGPNDAIEAYIHLENPNNGFPRRDPACFFDDPDYQRFEDGYRDWNVVDNTESSVRRFGTLNGFGNGRFATIVGAYRLKTLEESLYTGAGRRSARPYYARMPDVMGPADLSRVNTGILATGNRTGSSFTQTGTSVSAPFITRAAAELAGELSGVQAVIEKATAFEERIDRMPTIPHQQKGDGRYPLEELSEERELLLLRGLNRAEIYR